MRTNHAKSPDRLITCRLWPDVTCLGDEDGAKWRVEIRYLGRQAGLPKGRQRPSRKRGLCSTEMTWALSSSSRFARPNSSVESPTRTQGSSWGVDPPAVPTRDSRPGRPRVGGLQARALGEVGRVGGRALGQLGQLGLGRLKARPPRAAIAEAPRATSSPRRSPKRAGGVGGRRLGEDRLTSAQRSTRRGGWPAGWRWRPAWCFRQGRSARAKSGRCPRTGEGSQEQFAERAPWRTRKRAIVAWSGTWLAAITRKAMFRRSGARRLRGALFADGEQAYSRSASIIFGSKAARPSHRRDRRHRSCRARSDGPRRARTRPGDPRAATRAGSGGRRNS